MAATFDLASLIPEPLTFRDTDGKTYEAKTPEMFGAVDFARMTRLRTEMTAGFTALQAKKGDAEQAERLAADLEQMADALIALIVPDLPDARRTQIAFGHKFRFLNWWKEQQQVPPAGEAKAGGKVNRGRHSPASSASTASAPKTS
jgi:hypothetical protein